MPVLCDATKNGFVNKLNSAAVPTQTPIDKKLAYGQGWRHKVSGLLRVVHFIRETPSANRERPL